MGYSNRRLGGCPGCVEPGRGDGTGRPIAFADLMSAFLKDNGIGWGRLADPDAYLGETERIIDRVVARARRAACVGQQ